MNEELAKKLIAKCKVLGVEFAHFDETGEHMAHNHPRSWAQLVDFFGTDTVYEVYCFGNGLWRVMSFNKQRGAVESDVFQQTAGSYGLL